jgi:hypothetical protein
MPITVRASKPVSCIIQRACLCLRCWRRGWFGLLVEPWQGEGQRQGGCRSLRRPRRHREHDHAARSQHGATCCDAGAATLGWPRVPCASAAGGRKPVSSCSQSRGKDRKEGRTGGRRRTEELRSRDSGSRAVARREWPNEMSEERRRSCVRVSA